MTDKTTKPPASAVGKNQANRSGPGTCWFCGKKEGNGRKLIHVGTGFICNECVAAASKLMDKK